MRQIVVFFMFAGVGLVVEGRPQAPSEPIEIINYENEGVNPDGSYYFSYETGNGISQNERGEVKGAGSEDEAMSAQGAYSFVGLDGIKYEITYIADENGFQPKGDHLPTPPPIPPAIQRLLEYLEAHPDPESKNNNV